MTTRLASYAVIGAIALILPAANAYAEVRVVVRRGVVDVTAQQATIREILEAWTKAGGTTFLAVDQLPPEPISIELRETPERQALDILLRSTSGYVISPAAPGASIQSQFGSVVIVTRSAAGARSDAGAGQWLASLPTALPAAGDVGPEPDDAGGRTADEATAADVAERLAYPPVAAPGDPIGAPTIRPRLVPDRAARSSAPGMTGGGVSSASATVLPGAVAAPDEHSFSPRSADAAGSAGPAGSAAPAAAPAK